MPPGPIDRSLLRLRARRDELLDWGDHYPVVGVLLRIGTDLLKVDFRDRVFGLTGQAFLSIIPILILVSGFLSGSGSVPIADTIVERLDLHGETADLVQALFAQPEGAQAGLSVLSTVILLFSFNSFTRTMRRSIERPWGLPKFGWRSQLLSILAVAVYLVLHVVSSSLAIAWRGGPALTAVPEILAQTALWTAGWSLVIWLLSARRITWRQLWPGALVAGIAQMLAGWWTVTFLPAIFEKDALNYGVIGVALAIVSWLLVAAGVAVGVGIVGARIAQGAGWRERPPDDEDPVWMRSAGGSHR